MHYLMVPLQGSSFHFSLHLVKGVGTQSQQYHSACVYLCLKETKQPCLIIIPCIYSDTATTLKRPAKHIFNFFVTCLHPLGRIFYDFLIKITTIKQYFWCSLPPPPRSSICFMFVWWRELAHWLEYSVERSIDLSILAQFLPWLKHKKFILFTLSLISLPGSQT